MNNLFKKVVSLSLASALILSASSAALAAEVDDASENTLNGADSTANDSIYPDDLSDEELLRWEREYFADYETDVQISESGDIDEDHIVTSVEDYNDLTKPGSNRKSNAKVPNSASIPDECDNSTNENSCFFPAVGDQIGGSCCSWATTYYLYTYMMNKTRNVTTTPSNTYSPIWTFNFVNNGADEGAWENKIFSMMDTLGVAKVEDVPLINNIYDWHATGDIWAKASENRISNYYMFAPSSTTGENGNVVWYPVDTHGTPITSAKDSDLDAMKTALSDGNIFSFWSYVFSWDLKTIKASNDPGVDNRFVGQYAVSSEIGTDGSHEMTIVGYNDNIWIDANDNNQVDEGEMGAFKIANSWGAGYRNGGFCWVAYDALNKISAVPGVESPSNRYTIFGRVTAIVLEDKNYSSGLLVKAVLNTANRGETVVSINAENKETGAVTRRFVGPHNIMGFDGTSNNANLNYAGSTGACDGTMYFDLNNVISDITADQVTDYNWEVQITAPNSPVVVKELKFVDTVNNNEIDLTDGTQETLTNTTKTYVIENGELALDVTTDPTYYNAPSVITVNAKARGGVAPYQYRFEQVYDYHNETLLSDWTSSSSVTVPINDQGSYRFQVTVRDAEGTEVVKKIGTYVSDFWIYDLDTNTGVSSEIEEGNVGQTTTFKPTGSMNSNVLTAANFKYTITKNGVSTQYDPTNSSDYSLDFTPTEGGCYTVNLKVTYNNKTLADRTETFYVTDGAPANAIKIYYKGFNTPNIHYRPENGSWTSVPGVAMTPDTSVSGCTHSYTIYLNDNASYAEVCFNDGHNNWDSRNGANYRFNKGVYKFENGNITSIGSVSDMNVTLSLPGHVLLSGDKMPISASVTGGTAPYYFKFGFKKADDTTGGYTTKYSSDNTSVASCSTAPYSFDYDETITAYVMDSTGKVAQVSENVNYKSLNAVVKANKTSIEPGETVQISFEANGTIYDLHCYSYTVYDNDNNYLGMISADSNSVAEWTPTEAGTYRITGSLYNTGARFSSGYAEGTFTVGDVNTVTIYYKGYSNPNIHYQVGNGSWTSVPGVAMEATNEVSGYTHKYTINLGDATYANVCFNDGHGNWDSRNGANYYFTQGTYKFSNGQITAM